MGEAVYTLPNTPTEAIDEAHIYDNTLTKFVVAARLAYKDADNSLKPAEICEYKGQEFLGIDNLKKVFLNEISRYYKKVPVAAGEPDKYVNLDPSDITFTTDAPSGTQAKDYEVFATLAKPDITLYEQQGGVWNEVTDKSVVYNMLQGTPAEVRKGGMAYYYTTIKHLGKKVSWENMVLFVTTLIKYLSILSRDLVLLFITLKRLSFQQYQVMIRPILLQRSMSSLGV